MITRAARLIAALGGAAEDDPRLLAAARVLLESGAPPVELADEMIAALEEALPARRARRLYGRVALMIGAPIAAVSAAFGLRALFTAFALAGSHGWLLPLFALVPIAFAWWWYASEHREERESRRERAAVMIALRWINAGVPAPLALSSAGAVVELASEQQHALLELDDRALLAVRQAGGSAPPAWGPRSLRRIAPALAAVWAVACFWILYFGTVASGFIQAGMVK